MISAIDMLTSKIMLCHIYFTMHDQRMFFICLEVIFFCRTQISGRISCIDSLVSIQCRLSKSSLWWKTFSSLAQNLRGLVIFAVFIHWLSLFKFQHLLHEDAKKSHWEEDYEFMRSVNMHKQINEPREKPLFPGYQTVEAVRMSSLK